jgi:L-alanine-DL-glutamate epimerase-like enolase superfamily enzyme
MGDKSPGPLKEEVAEAAKQGFKSFKIKIGLNIEHDVACVKAAREAAGPHLDIGFDVNGGYTAAEAIVAIHKMEQYDPSHIEEPVNSINIRAMAQVRAHTHVPILCCGHGCTTKETIQELVFQNAADAVNLDMCRNGGFMETIRCAAVAEAGGLKASCHSSPGELGIATAAQVHMVTCIPSFLEPVDSSYTKMLPPAEDIITKPFVYKDGTLTPPDGPGLGVEIDPDAFAKAKRRYEKELDKWQHVRGEDPRVPSRQFYYYHDFPENHEWQASEWQFRGDGSHTRSKARRTAK